MVASSRETAIATSRTTYRMSLYFAHPTDSRTNQVVSSAVKDRGLSLLRAKPCDVQISVLPAIVQRGYASYTKNLPAFMFATMAQKPVAIANRGYPITTVPDTLPWKLPSLIYDFSQPPRDNVIEGLMTHSTLVTGRKNKSFVMTNVTLEKIQDLVRTHPTINSKTPHVINTVNLDAMKMVFVIGRVLSAFLLTHVYAAVRHDSDPTMSSGGSTETSKKRKLSTTSFVAYVSDRTLDEDPVGDDAEADVEATPDPDPTTEIVLRRAKPTPVSDDRWGPSESIPNTSGLYVPYVKDLAVGETITVPALFASTFIRALSSESHGMFEQIERLRSAWGIIATTELGLEITHLCKCIDIALQAQAYVYPIYSNNVYEGTVICGAGYSVNVRGRTMTPMPYEQLQELVRESSAHSRSLREIADLVGDGTSFANIGTMRQLSTIVKGKELDEMSKQSIVKAAHHLSFRAKYKSTNPTNIVWMLEHLLDPERHIESDVPMHPSFLFSTNRVELVLSAFGHQAPTFMIPNGAVCGLVGDTPPRNLHVRTVGTSSAILDMKYIVEKGQITNNMSNLSSKHIDQSLNGRNKVAVWNLLRDLYRAANEGTQPDTDVQTYPPGDDVDHGLW